VGVSVKKWLYNVLIGFDQFANALALGDPDETISARIGRQKLEGRLNWFTYPLEKFLNWLDTDHSVEAIEPDEGDDDAFTD
jgi:hypothetical protein